MDTPRVVILGSPVAVSVAFAVWGSFTAEATRWIFASGLAVAMLLMAYTVLRLRGDLVLHLATLGLLQALVFNGMYARCVDHACAALRPVWDAFHVGAFGAGLAAASVLVASVPSKTLRQPLRRAVAAGVLAVLTYAVLASGWALRARAL